MFRELHEILHLVAIKKKIPKGNNSKPFLSIPRKLHWVDPYKLPEAEPDSKVT